MIRGVIGTSLRSYCSYAIRSVATKPLLQQACLSKCVNTPSFATLRFNRLSEKSITNSVLWRLYCTSPNTPVSQNDKKSGVEPAKAKKPTMRDYARPAHSKLPADGSEYVTEDMIVESMQNNKPVMTFEQKAKETAKTTWYTLIMLLGISFLLACVTVVWQELFSPNSTNRIYGDVARIVRRNTEVKDMLGEPMTAHGEHTSRGWRRHVMHTQFYNDGKLYLRMRFYLKGGYRNATVNVEKIANEKGKFDKYTYILVEADGYPPRTIEIDVDNL